MTSDPSGRGVRGMLNDLLHGRDDDLNDEDAANGDGTGVRYADPERPTGPGAPGTAVSPGQGDGPRPAPRPGPPAPPAPGAHRLADATDPAGSLFGRDGGSPTWPPTFGARSSDQWTRPAPGHPTEPRPPAPPAATAPTPPPMTPPAAMPVAPTPPGPGGAPDPHGSRAVGGPGQEPDDHADDRIDDRIDDHVDDRADDRTDDRADGYEDDPVDEGRTTAMPVTTATAPDRRDRDVEPIGTGPSGTATIPSSDADTDTANTESSDIDSTDNGRATTATTFAAAPPAPAAPMTGAATPFRPAAPAAPSDPGTAEPLVPRDRAEALSSRWDAVKGSFVDDPRDAVRAADDLVGELLDELDRALREQRAALEHELDDDGATTEDLRQALRRYRSFFDRIMDV